MILEALREARACVLVVNDPDADPRPCGRSRIRNHRRATSAHETIALIDVNLGGVREGMQPMQIFRGKGNIDMAEWQEVRTLPPVAVLPKPCPPSRVIEALRSAVELGKH